MPSRPGTQQCGFWPFSPELATHLLLLRSMSASPRAAIDPSPPCWLPARAFDQGPAANGFVMEALPIPPSSITPGLAKGLRSWHGDSGINQRWALGRCQCCRFRGLTASRGQCGGLDGADPVQGSLPLPSPLPWSCAGGKGAEVRERRSSLKRLFAHLDELMGEKKNPGEGK